VGDLWWDSVGALLYLYYQDPTSTQWVNINNSGGIPEAPTDGKIYARQGSTASWQAAAAAGTAGTGSIVAINFYTSSQTITIPAGATKAFVQMSGASGGSGGVSNNVSGGSGAGGYLEKYLTALTAGNTLVYTQGAAGTAGAAGNSTGGNGGVTTLASGTQAIGTLTCNGSNGTTYGSPVGANLGGTASGGDLNLQGQSGQSPPTITSAGNQTPVGGARFFSLGANGVNSASSVAGNAGNPGTLKITWYA
jgi:hypothetical protein